MSVLLAVDNNLKLTKIRSSLRVLGMYSYSYQFDTIYVLIFFIYRNLVLECVDLK